MNPALQYRNYGKSSKRVLIPALQYRNFESAKKKVIDSIAFLKPPSSDRTTVSQKQQRNRTRAPMTAGVWRAGDFRVSARTLPEPRQKHRFLQRPRAIWRAPVGTVEQLLLWIRIEAEQQRERDLTRRSAARRIFMHFLRGS